MKTKTDYLKYLPIVFIIALLMSASSGLANASFYLLFGSLFLFFVHNYIKSKLNNDVLNKRKYLAGIVIAVLIIWGYYYLTELGKGMMY